MRPKEAPREEGEAHAAGIPNCWEEGPQAFLPSPGRVPEAWLEVRLRELQALLAAGLIAPEEYEALRTEALEHGHE